ncbi:META domain-containing protein [Streptomyces sp. NPDC026672]|uniref:META domain-containing protein n=1 Tax=unclassified Streptomyces TaxID=2593676 RepID=UPI0034026B9A
MRDARITLGTPRTTRMMCDASLMHTEKRPPGFSDGAVTYRLGPRAITLTRENTETVFVAPPL